MMKRRGIFYSGEQRLQSFIRPFPSQRLTPEPLIPVCIADRIPNLTGRKVGGGVREKYVKCLVSPDTVFTEIAGVS